MQHAHWPRFIPLSERKAKAEERIQALRAQGVDILPERATGRDMASSVWGRGWCWHMQSLPRIGKHLPRGKIYARNGSIRHLEIRPGQIKALVMGTDMYEVIIPVLPVSGNVWQEIKDLCVGRVASVQEIYQGRVPGDVMAKLLDVRRGINPGSQELSLRCECSENRPLCKHVAAALYGTGSRLDKDPELLFTLRGVKAQDLVTSWTRKLRERFEEKKNILQFDQAKDIFDLEWDEDLGISDSQAMHPARHRD